MSTDLEILANKISEQAEEIGLLKAEVSGCHCADLQYIKTSIRDLRYELVGRGFNRVYASDVVIRIDSMMKGKW